MSLQTHTPTAAPPRPLRLPGLQARHAFAPVRVRDAKEPESERVWERVIGDASQLILQQCQCPGKTSTLHDADGYVLTHGVVQATFPSLSVEKEFFQAINEKDCLPDGIDLKASDSVDLWRINEAVKDQAFVYKLLSKPENAYIAREMCWTLQPAGGAGAYALHVRDEEDLALFIAALKVDDQTKARVPQLVYGRAAGMPSPECRMQVKTGITVERMLPVTQASVVDQVLKLQSGYDRAKVLELVEQAWPLLVNPGRTDRERAVSWLALQYPQFYAQSYALRYQSQAPDQDGFALSGVEGMAEENGVMDVRLSYVSRNTNREEYRRCRIDLRGVYPFLVDGLKPFFF